jgi:hypothetical protein
MQGYRPMIAFDLQNARYSPLRAADGAIRVTPLINRKREQGAPLLAAAKLIQNATRRS